MLLARRSVLVSAVLVALIASAPAQAQAPAITRRLSLSGTAGSSLTI